MDATLYTDASFRAPNEGGWGVWLRSNRGRIIASGPCPDYVTCSNTAEMAAIFAGVHLALTHWGDSPLDKLLLVTDSQTAIRWLEQRLCLQVNLDQEKLSPRERLQSKIEQALGSRVRLNLRWTRGHQRTDTRPAWVNDKVDDLAGKARRSRQATFYRSGT